MSIIFGETLTFDQENGPDVRLVVFGDEFYARFEDTDGYSVMYDTDLGLFCYAVTLEGRFVSSGVPMSQAPPPDVRRHLEEAEAVRSQVLKERRRSSIPPAPLHSLHDTERTFGPNQGLLSGRRLSTGAAGKRQYATDVRLSPIRRKPQGSHHAEQLTHPAADLDEVEPQGVQLHPADAC